MIIKKEQLFFPLLTSSYYFRGSWLQLVRPLTLTGTIIPILVGTAYAAQSTVIRWGLFSLFLSLFVYCILFEMTRQT